VEIVIHSDNDFASVAFLRIKNAILEPKNNITPPLAFTPALLESDFIAVRDSVMESQGSAMPPKVTLSEHAHLTETRQPSVVCKKLGSWVYIADIHGDISGDPEISIEAEVQECFHRLQGTAHSSCHAVALFNLFIKMLCPRTLSISHIVLISTYSSHPWISFHA
jgi:diphthine-ammonia ligase